ncbi:MAG: HAMP domain-containing histidine kinase [Christensenellaceae bacterium]|nr:HAMP domain-containing histidine kinase [Christensenellaceae bacterium]
MAVVLAVILLLTTVLTSLGVMALRTRQIDTRLEELRKEAREIAYLAAQSSGSTIGYLFGQDSAMLQYLNWKAAEVYKDFGACILVVDRTRRVRDNFQSAYAENPSFVASLNGKELSEALTRVLAGDEIDVRQTIDGSPAFTVGVPFVQDGMVLGAVLIQTPAQVVEGGAAELIVPVLLVALAALLVSGAVIFLLIRRVMRPLRELTGASRAMSEGDFAVRVQPGTNTPEIAELATAFNTMADRLSLVESQRREFVANVSHELRSPITSIRGFIEGMEDGTIPPEEHAKYLSIVGGETRRLSKLIGDLLALSRLEREDAALTLSDFDMCEMLRRAVIRRVSDLEQRRMELVCDFFEEPCMVRADADRIEQVVVNLLDNAIKFTPEGGTITLSTAMSKELCTVTVADNGVGVSPEDAPRVFERFFTADRAHTAGKGTGLGLSICQRILEMHGQSIRLLDAPEGAAFAFTLPRS